MMSTRIAETRVVPTVPICNARAQIKYKIKKEKQARRDRGAARESAGTAAGPILSPTQAPEGALKTLLHAPIAQQKLSHASIGHFCWFEASKTSLSTSRR